MPSTLLGRTNRAFPPVWLSLAIPPRASEGDAIQALVSAARESNVPIDISNGPALWGGHMRGADEAFLTQTSTSGYANASDDRHACDLVQAHLIETLSAIGREWIDIYYLRVRSAVDEAQLSGALEALELARQEGHIRFLGIACDGPALATLGLWQFHDAFDVVSIPRSHYDQSSYETLAPMANERRVGIVTTKPTVWGYDLSLRELGASPELIQAALADLSQHNPVVKTVRSPRDIELALSASVQENNTLAADLSALQARWESAETWKEFAASELPHLRSAARKRETELSGSYV